MTSERLSIRLISFDVGGTLIHAHPSVGTVYAEVLCRRGFNCAAEEVDRAFEESWEFAASHLPPSSERYSRSVEGERGYWRELLRDTVSRLGGSEPPAGAADELFERFARADTWRVYPDVLPTLQELDGRGMPMAVVSNWDSRLPGLLRDLGLRRFFGPLLVSALEACEKPDSRIFHRAAQRAGVLPREVLHVGDRDREDLQGALRAGCLALKIDRNGGGGIGLAAVLRRLEENGAIADGGSR
ncbi:MAG: HAD-IA family hydrolase [Acidobacteria bacterium]|nr:HAD-IA family hydrolase [Acidobacteriota bacterium]